ncbi:FAD-binding oxidoreductase [Alkalihalobacillus sp. TS-13]|uniref:NAD(P)/FAD-dependent oxidoreductase n=1 Tax=Alkalihalobacillus sp. TS-13 TaxID=2842455 RepID=UPI001C876803|nr:FAD-dependent oxidoreductase [Alkalihalobacillus sp. TS-13]
MTDQYDIVIIGCGVIGSSIAYHLSEYKQKRILVIDKGFPLSGTSGSTQAWVWVHNKVPSWYGELSMYSAELYPFLERKIGDVEYKRTGGIAPFFAQTDWDKALRLAEEQAEVGIKVEVLTRDQVLEKEPALSPKIAGATYSDMDGNVNPFRLVELYIKAAKRNEVEFSFYNPVTEMVMEKDHYKIYTKNKKDAITTERVILAGGPWSKEIGELLGLDIPVKQVRGQVIITEPLAPFLKHTIGGMRQAENGEVLIGFSKEEVGYDRRTTMDVIQETAQMAINYIPSLAKANIVRSFSGVRVIPEDGFPILGKIPDKKNAYIAAMHSGVTLSPLVGTLMAELVMVGETSICLKRYSLKRFMNYA